MSRKIAPMKNWVQTETGDSILSNLFGKHKATRRTNPAAIAAKRPEPLALPILAKRDNLDRSQWLEFAESCDIPKKAAQRVLDAQASALPPARLLLERCLLPPDLKRQYRQLIEDRTQALLPNR